MIDLTKPYTVDDVANLLASKDDSQNRQLRVSKSGEAYISDAVGSENIKGLAFRLETWIAGKGYTGKGAASDHQFVAQIEKVLRKNWPNPESAYIDVF